MLNRSASLVMSTSVLKALPGKLDIRRHSPSILYVRSTSANTRGFSFPTCSWSEFSLPKVASVWKWRRSSINSFGTAPAFSVKSDLGCILRVNVDYVTLTSQKPCQDNISSITAKQTVTPFHETLYMGFDARKSVVGGGCKQQMRRHILVLQEYWILTEIRIPLKPVGARGRENCSTYH